MIVSCKFTQLNFLISPGNVRGGPTRILLDWGKKKIFVLTARALRAVDFEWAPLSGGTHSAHSARGEPCEQRAVSQKNFGHVGGLKLTG